MFGLRRILKYSEAEYSPPDYIVEMESEEKQGDEILVSGIRTGAAVIKVRMQEPTYKVGLEFSIIAMCSSWCCPLVQNS